MHGDTRTRHIHNGPNQGIMWLHVRPVLIWEHTTESFFDGSLWSGSGLYGDGYPPDTDDEVAYAVMDHTMARRVWSCVH